MVKKDDQAERERAQERLKPGGAGPGTAASDAVAPGKGTTETTPKGDLEEPGGMGRGLAEHMREREED